MRTAAHLAAAPAVLVGVEWERDGELKVACGVAHNVKIKLP